MQTFAHYALPAAIAASALGAIVLCLILLLYGFATAADDEPRFPSRRLFAIRVGHALAATCFAAVVMLTAVAFLEQRREALSAPPPATAASSGDAALDARVAALEQRLGAVEQRAGETPGAAVTAAPPTAPASPAVARRAVAPRRPAASDRARRAASEEIPPLPPRGAGESPLNGAAGGNASPTAATSSHSPSRDWEIVKRGFRSAGEDIQSGFNEFARRVKRTFGSDTR